MLDIMSDASAFGTDHPDAVGGTGLLSGRWRVSLHIAAEVWP